MYLKHFGLEHKPFSITPDPRFLFLSERYREALAHLLYGVGEGGGFVLLTGEVGTGKTTLCRGLLEQLPANVDAALVINPKLNARELLETVCDELHVERAPGEMPAKALIDALNRHLLAAHAAGRRTVLIIDEAQNLDAEALEQVRLLTNLETATDKLLQIILIGQPELRDLLTRHDLRQLAQRITARYHLGAMSREEVRTYIAHRLRLAGGEGGLFNAAALRLVYRASGGIPRLVNTICDRALLGAYAGGKRHIDAATVRHGAREVLSGSGGAAWRPLWVVATVVVLLAGGWALARFGTPTDAPIAAADASLAAPSVEPAATAENVAPVPPEAAPVAETLAAQPPPAPSDAAEAEPDALQTADDGTPAAEPRPDTAREVPMATVSAEIEPAPPPAEPPEGDDRDPALRRLASLWGVALPEGGDACKALTAHGLACYDGRSSWASLRLLDLPALLALPRADGSTGYVLLAGLDGDRPRLAAGEAERSVPFAALGNRWFGDFTVIWPPPAGQRLLRPGQRDPLVTWLRARLDAFDGDTVPAADPGRYDARLELRVKRFQSVHGLEADGLVGTRTLLQLAAPDVRGPRLADEG